MWEETQRLQQQHEVDVKKTNDSIVALHKSSAHARDEIWDKMSAFAKQREEPDCLIAKVDGPGWVDLLRIFGNVGPPILHIVTHFCIFLIFLVSKIDS